MHRRLIRHVPDRDTRFHRLCRHVYYTALNRATPHTIRDEFRDRFFSPDAFDRYLDEFEQVPAADRIPDPRSYGLEPAATGRLYALIREMQPDTVVETGVGPGVSTTAILRALDRNGRGHLHSLDSLAYGSIGEVGALVPNDLTDRWTMHTGRSQDVLPDILAGVNEVDLFLHDSEHTRECMRFEYETVWPHLRSGGVLVSDDVHWNDAFASFRQDHDDASGGMVTPRVGYVVKDGPQ